MSLNKKSIILLVFLSLILIISLFYLSTLFHEMGHQNEANKYKISMNIHLEKPDFSSRTFPMGSASFYTIEDCDKFNNLLIDPKSEILFGGIKNDALTSIILLIFSFIFMIFSIFSLLYIKKDTLSLLFLAIWLVLITIAIWNISNILTNLKYFYGTDFYWIFNKYPC